MKIQLLEFIKQHQNWKDLIQEKPYRITVKEDSEYILLSYSQIDSDFSLELVRECRGIILRKSDLRIVCFPFLKFFNVQERHASKIDWSSAKVQQKLDGSIIKCWYDDMYWHVSTNGTIDARNAELQMPIGDIKNYYDLFMSADNISDALFYRLDVNKTYMFELVSPYNRVVVPYKRTQAYHIGTRDNNTFEESNDYIGVYKPNEFDLYTLEDCLRTAEQLPFNEEGYVAIDKYFNRVKIKSPAYVVAHHLKNNGVITKERIVDMIRLDGQDDFLSIYPEWKEPFEEIENAISFFAGRVINDMISMPSKDVPRKEFAMWAKNTNCPPFFFALLDRWENIHTPLDWLWLQTSEKILIWIGVK